jgi:putative transposase
MKLNGIQAKGKRKFKITTDSNHRLLIAENKLNQSFEAQHLNQKWTADITAGRPRYIWTNDGWLYLASRHRSVFQESGGLVYANHNE